MFCPPDNWAHWSGQRVFSSCGCDPCPTVWGTHSREAHGGCAGQDDQAQEKGQDRQKATPVFSAVMSCIHRLLSPSNLWCTGVGRKRDGPVGAVTRLP